MKKRISLQNNFFIAELLDLIIKLDFSTRAHCGGGDKPVYP